MDKKTTGIVCWLTLIGWLIAFLAGDKENSKFQLNQSLNLLIVSTIISILQSAISGLVVSIILWLISVVVFVFWIIGFVRAIKEEETPLPIIGGIQLIK